MNKTVAMLSAAALMVLSGCTVQFGDHDDSDGPNENSGMFVRTDYKTGLQYLEGGKGGLTPRLDADGNQMQVQVQ